MSETDANGWLDISTAPKDGTRVILAVPHYESGWNIGEAYFDASNPEDGDWWWAGSSAGDYWASPLRECNHHPPSHWQPLPNPPVPNPPSEGETR
ncbi:hypothetical protein [Mesorhizobium jarvisii]|uniref:hypothetical protein n=1 Tax=Mesorhizobium jarvisii TaxID=1777867 RepID=UPI000B2DEEC4|nr:MULTISPECIES: hypothetical protein [Mesorhizobium]